MNNDLISREALKEAFHKDIMGGLNWKSIIDNAPPVETYTYHDVKIANNNGYVTAMKEYARPQGEWKTVEGYDGDEYYECSNCGEPWFLSAGTPKDNNMNFCPNCGAEMKGGAE